MSETASIHLPGQEAVAPERARALWSALEAKGPDYAPRTEHLRADGRPSYVNRLIFETSPYLLQHAHNPVDWWAWGEHSQAEAARLDRPIFLSVGYSTCHWCHVMERESFEDEEIAAYLNAHFLPIKVDREERPDVDGVYMTAVQLMTGGGGWPMTVVMLPDGRPFFAGTYFPPRAGERGARLGLLDILKRLHEAYAGDKEKLVAQAQHVSQVMQTASRRQAPEAIPGDEALVRGARLAAKRFDELHGGVGRAPKFPTPSLYGLLLRVGRRTQDPLITGMVTETLHHMANGGIHDQLGGGFARYSTDRAWLVPHFEKMLYDNAQLLELYVEAFQATGKTRFREVAETTARYLLDEMRDPEGPFYSATDADSEGEEGRYFVWSLAEIEALLSPDEAEVFVPLHGVTAVGNFEGANVLHRARSPAELAKEKDISLGSMNQRLEQARAKLLAHRKQRVPPLLDDKIVTAWNALAIGALARAGAALDRPEWIRRAEDAATFIEGTMWQGDRLLRTHRRGKSQHDGVLEDHAFLFSALLDLFEASGRRTWLDQAERCRRIMDARFWDEEAGAYFGTASDAEALLTREHPFYDGAMPSGNGVAALALLRWHQLTDDETARERANRILLRGGQALDAGALDCPKLGQALDFVMDEAMQVVVAQGTEPGPLPQQVASSFLPNAVRIVLGPDTRDTLLEALPWLEGKGPRQGETTVYVCRSQICDRPSTEPEALAQSLARFADIEAEPVIYGRKR
ncbi:MAG: thioredoxin domain-containing protein [Myxococcota bacterium]